LKRHANEARMIMSDHARAMTDEQIAKSLEYQATLAISGLARAIMQEAARRLRERETRKAMD
jgi:hypothetical protein